MWAAAQTFASDPYLAYRPSFAETLPIQVLASGITLTLLVVLVIHLLFTTQYHYPLAPLNYCLQLASILAVLGTLVTKIAFILMHSTDSAGKWPYDLSYIEVKIPAATWSTASKATWFFFMAINNGLAHITHIQFLTLLYPSRIEARLILLVLGPLAIAASGITFTRLSTNQTVYDLGDAVRNVFNSTLLLIYGFSLAIWGFAVNRRRAWRLDGGTAVFGGGALALAAATTACNFVAIREDGLDWLQHLLWASVLWQTWLGWWWWVGAGMGIGEVEDMVERAERKKRKATRRARAGARGPPPTEASNSSSAARRLRPAHLVGAVRASTTAVAGGMSSGLAALRPAAGPRRRRRPSGSASGELDVEQGDAIELADLGSAASSRRSSAGAPAPAPAPTGPRAPPAPHASTQSETSTTSRTPSAPAAPPPPPRTLAALLAYPHASARAYLAKLQRAHAEAAAARATEHAARRSRAYRTDDEGWGLGSAGLRARAEGARRIRDATETLRAGRLLRRDSALSDAVGAPGAVGAAAGRAGTARAEPGGLGGGKEDEWEDVRPEQAEQAEQAERPAGFSWWGPIREWRLADRSTY